MVTNSVAFVTIEGAVDPLGLTKPGLRGIFLKNTQRVTFGNFPPSSLQHGRLQLVRLMYLDTWRKSGLHWGPDYVSLSSGNGVRRIRLSRLETYIGGTFHVRRKIGIKATRLRSFIMYVLSRSPMYLHTRQ